MNQVCTDHTASYRVIREPKGGPDAVLIAPQSSEDVLVRAGNILSVMGYTARLIVYGDGNSFIHVNIPHDLLLPVAVCIAGEQQDICRLTDTTVLPLRTDADLLARSAFQAINKRDIDV